MNYEKTFYKPQISSAHACYAAEIDGATLRNWVSREPNTILLDKNERLPGDRPTFALQLATVYQIAIVAALVQLGIGPRLASQWAWAFTEVDAKDRDACALFEDGFTYLAGDTKMEEPLILNVTEKMSAYHLLAMTDAGSPVILLNLNGVIERVNRALEI